SIAAIAAIAAIAFGAASGCTDESWSGEHHPIGALTIKVVGAGSLSARTWNAATACTVDEDANVQSTTCRFPIEDDAAEIVLEPLDLTGTLELTVTACGKVADEESYEVRGDGISLRPRDVLLGVSCPSYPVIVEAKFGAAPPDEDAGADSADDDSPPEG
ncbi:MAG: hypothetical protein ABI175_12280, partial [Polyangiales bacterium]